MYARPSPPGGGGLASRHRHHTVRGRQPRIPRACTPTEPPRNRVENYPSRAHHPGPFHPSPYLAFNRPVPADFRPAPLPLRVPSCSRQPGAVLVRTWPSGGDGLWRRIVPGAVARPLSVVTTLYYMLYIRGSAIAICFSIFTSCLDLLQPCP